MRKPKEFLQEHSPKESIFKRLAKLLTHRLFFGAVFILLQVALIVLMIGTFSTYFIQFYFVCIALSFLVTLRLINSQTHPDYKIGWIILIMAFPLFGGLFYLITGGSSISRRRKERMNHMEELTRQAVGNCDDILNALSERNPEAAKHSRYLFRTCYYPPAVHTGVTYLPLGEDGFRCLLEELEKAQHYIFLEYFIIKEGVMWDTILDVLERKAGEGLDVRVLYDDIGCLFTLPKHYARTLESKGIACRVFNPFHPMVSIHLNNRDHRKLCVIDGHTGFTGGWNLSDEYINQWERFGHWKDNGVMLKGDAVWNLTVMFLSAWDFESGIDEDFELYRPSRHLEDAVPTAGIVHPYCTSPLQTEAVGAMLYRNLIFQAERYVYITTPYLVIDYSMTEALTVAARSGVDVRIITPHIPDKRYVFELTRAHYAPLMEAGVRIYEYTPGFIHAKTFAIDDEYAVVGTVNLDYRSMYLHFEDGVLMYNSPAVIDIRNDFLATQAKSQEVVIEQTRHLSWLKRLYRAVLRVVAPLL